MLTHQHVDHVGLADILARRSGAEVCAIDVLVPVLADFGAAAEADDELAARLMLRHGLARDVVLTSRAWSRAMRAWGASVEVTRPLRDGDVLEFARRRWGVHRRPGHSPSDTVFFDAERRELIGGDHLIAHISSNPLIARSLDDPGEERPRALLSYLRSLEQTRAMDVQRILTGHGDPVTDHRALIDDRLALHERRARKIHRLVSEEPRTAHEIARAMWGDVAVTQAFLTLSEVLGHLDVLTEQGAVSETLDGEVARFRAAP